VWAGAAAAHQHEAALAQMLGEALGSKASREVPATTACLASSIEAQRMGEGGRDFLIGGGDKRLG
jgi:hypothetical protein